MGTPKSDDSRVPGHPSSLRQEILAVLTRHGLTTNKRLGQHFLISESVVSSIVARAVGAAGILEIGPGPGVLTRPLLTLTPDVTAVELDGDILPALMEFAPGAQIVEGDALQIDLSQLLETLPEPRVLVSNMPYNITGPLLTRFAESRLLYDRSILMMQREVGDRILSPPGNRNRGSLSVYLEAQFKVERVCLVPPGAFLPPPKVDSIVLMLTSLPLRPVEARLFPLVRRGFTQPRKTLANNLQGYLDWSKDQANVRLAHAGLKANVRPHEVTLVEWEALALLD